MSGLLFGAGAAAVVVGVVMVGFGIPISEFSFGNTLIVAGTTAAVGGLIVIGLNVVVTHLQRIAELLSTRPPVRSSRPLDTFEAAAGSRAAPAQGRMPLPANSKSDSGMHEPYPGMAAHSPAYMPFEERAAHSFAPTLRNPDEPPVTVAEEVSLSPQQAMAGSYPGEPARPVPKRPPYGINESGLAARRNEPTLDTGWRSPPAGPARPQQPNTAYFDKMWPAEAKPAKSPAASEARPEPRLDPPSRETAAAPAKGAEPGAPKQRPASAPHAVAILKSGIVDGMGYTLFVDGSIEAELPQGTLRFASINELRSYLEKNS
jgi:hypothetical protein